MSLFQYDPTGYEYMKLRESADIEARAMERRKKRACDSNGCRYEWGGDCFTGEPDKCEYCMELNAKTIAKKKARMLCGETEDECWGIEDCPDEPCHCEVGLELLMERAESRREGDR